MKIGALGLASVQVQHLSSEDQLRLWWGVRKHCTLPQRRVLWAKYMLNRSVSTMAIKFGVGEGDIWRLVKRAQQALFLGMTREVWFLQHAALFYEMLPRQMFEQCWEYFLRPNKKAYGSCSKEKNRVLQLFYSRCKTLGLVAPTQRTILWHAFDLVRTANGEQMETDCRQFGTVKWFGEDKGFGFIVPDSGTNDVYLHRATLIDEGEEVHANDRVSYVLRDHPKGPRAFAVKIERRYTKNAE